MNDNMLIASLNTLLSDLRALQQLLDDDKNYFVKKDMNSIEESNNKKSILLDNIALIGQQLNKYTQHDQARNFLEAFSKGPAELKKLAHVIEAEMSTCYESLAINNKIVFTNIQRLKEFWAKLSLLNNEKTCVYDQKACTSTK